MADKIYPEGIFTFKPNPKAPDFVLGTICITLDEFNNWIDSHNGYLTEYKGKSQLKLTVVTRKGGGINILVDNYDSKPKNEPDF